MARRGVAPVGMRRAAWVLLVGLVMVQAMNGAPLFLAQSSSAIIRVPADFSTIQGAIDAASPGDTIIVSSRTYRENLVVSKSINLTGASRDTTIIDAQGNGPGISIVRADSVSVTGFAVRNTGVFDSAIVVDSSSNIIIFKNLLQASGESNGTYVYNSNSVFVRDNILTGNYYGVAVQGGAGNSIRMNNATGNAGGLGLFNTQGNEVKDNLFLKGQSGVDITDGSRGNVVARNRISNNTSWGVILQNGARDNWVVENEVSFNKAFSYTVGVEFQGATGNTLYYNSIRNNSIQILAPSSGDITFNAWDDGSSNPRGNYWSDYAGLDDGSNGRVTGDGVGDTLIPHPCPNGGRPCSSTGPAGVDIYPLIRPYQVGSLNVTARADKTSGFPPLLVSLTGEAEGGNPPYVYRWDSGNGNTTTGQNVTFSYGISGNYVAKLTVTDDASATRLDLVAVTVLARPSPGPPNLALLLGLAIGAPVALAVVGVAVYYRRKRMIAKGRGPTLPAPARR